MGVAQVVDNPSIGRLEVVETGASTGGALVVVQAWYRPGSRRSPALRTDRLLVELWSSRNVLHSVLVLLRYRAEFRLAWRRRPARARARPAS